MALAWLRWQQLGLFPRQLLATVSLTIRGQSGDFALPLIMPALGALILSFGPHLAAEPSQQRMTGLPNASQVSSSVWHAAVSSGTAFSTLGTGTAFILILLTRIFGPRFLFGERHIVKHGERNSFRTLLVYSLSIALCGIAALSFLLAGVARWTKWSWAVIFAPSDFLGLSLVLSLSSEVLMMSAVLTLSDRVTLARFDDDPLGEDESNTGNNLVRASSSTELRPETEEVHAKAKRRRLSDLSGLSQSQLQKLTAGEISDQRVDDHSPKPAEPEPAEAKICGVVGGRQCWRAVRRIGYLTTETGANVIVGMCFVLVLTGVSKMISYFLSFARDVPTRILNSAIACFCIALAVPLTHGLGGHLKFSKTGRPWRFIQPFAGGWKFVTVQAISWALFALSLLGFLAQFALLSLITVAPESWGLSSYLPTLAIWSAVTGLLAEVFIAISLACFEPDKGARGLEPVDKLKTSLECSLMLSVLYTTPHLSIALMSMVVGILSPAYSAWVLALFFGAYGMTYRGKPELTGARAWPLFQDWLRRKLDVALKRWCGGVTLEVTFDYDLDPSRKYVFGFHPHGMYPVSAAWLTQTKTWKERLPDIQPPTLGASAMFQAPLVRDPIMWVGVREVSRASFRRSLEHDKSALLCPGGQREMLEHTGRAEEIVICTRHKGFIRFAIQHGACLVPIFSFSEAVVYTNFLQYKPLQQWTYKRIGFPIPHLPGGYLGFLPLPRRIPQVFVVGEPIDTQEIAKDRDVDEDLVNEVKRLYYSKLENLVEETKHRLGYGHARLVFKED